MVKVKQVRETIHIYTRKSLARIDRIYTIRKIYESTAEWTIEENNRILDHQIITTTIHSMNFPSIEKNYGNQIQKQSNETPLKTK